jgi:hypothetical protein
MGTSPLSAGATEPEWDGIADACLITLNSKADFFCLRRIRGGSDLGASEVSGDGDADGRVSSSSSSLASFDLSHLAGCSCMMVVVVGKG